MHYLTYDKTSLWKSEKLRLATDMKSCWKMLIEICQYQWNWATILLCASLAQRHCSHHIIVMWLLDIVSSTMLVAKCVFLVVPHITVCITDKVPLPFSPIGISHLSSQVWVQFYTRSHISPPNLTLVPKAQVHLSITNQSSWNSIKYWSNIHSHPVRSAIYNW
jgi:hypothetical protein